MPKRPIPEEYEGRKVVTAAEMAELDRRASAEFGVPSLVLMERAGKEIADLSAVWLSAKTSKAVGTLNVAVCCGRGNNGGDGLVAARHLRKGGASVTAFLIPAKEGGYPAEVQEYLRQAIAAGVEVRQLAEDTAELDRVLAASDGVLDAVLGTGSSGKPAGLAKAAIQRMMKSGKPLIAVDIPSGIHPDTGYHSGVFVTAALTITLERMKRGLLAAHADKNVGELKVADLQYPPALR